MKNSFSLAVLAVAAVLLLGTEGCLMRKPASNGGGPPAQPSPTGAPNLQCGDTITTSVTLSADLDCPATAGSVLTVLGSNITVDGGGHVITAPNAAAGIFVQGSGITVQNFYVNGIAGGDGILAYEAPGVVIQNNDVSGNEQGILVFSDTNPLPGAQIINNVAQGDALFGVHVGYNPPGAIVSPVIGGNDLSASGSFALFLEATRLDFGGAEPNVYTGSANGIYVAGGTASVHDLDLSQAQIQNVGVFAANLQSLALTNVNATSTAPARAQTQSRIGADLYRVGSFTVSGFNGAGNDVGLEVDTELGTSPVGTITASSFASNGVGGILLASYDGTPYGLLHFSQNCFQLPSGVGRVVSEPGVTTASGSSLDDGQNACGAP